MQQAIQKLQKLGKMPDGETSEKLASVYTNLMMAITMPVTYEEASVLVKLFPASTFYGLELTLLAQVESVFFSGSTESEYTKLIEQCPNVEFLKTLRTNLDKYRKLPRVSPKTGPKNQQFLSLVGIEDTAQCPEQSNTAFIDALIERRVLSAVPFGADWPQIKTALETMHPGICAHCAQQGYDKPDAIDTFEILARASLDLEKHGYTIYIVWANVEETLFMVENRNPERILVGITKNETNTDLQIAAHAINLIIIPATMQMASNWGDYGRRKEHAEDYKGAIKCYENEVFYSPLSAPGITFQIERLKGWISAAQNQRKALAAPMTIAQLRDEIASHPDGHLSRCHRIALMGRIKKPALINRIFFECVKRTLPVWDKKYPAKQPVPLHEILSQAEDFLYRRTGKKKDFIALADKHSNEIERLNNNAGAVALAALYLCYSIACDAAVVLDTDDYEGEDDDAFDYTDNPPDLYAAMAFSGGNHMAHKGSDKKRKEYWNWYLDTVEQLGGISKRE